MQDRYVGDIGDFAKYSLLRGLCSGFAALRLGVVWCRFPDEGHNNDGRHISYLRDEAFGSLDRGLHASLAQIVHHGSRKLSSVESSDCLPKGTIFFDECTTGEASEGSLGDKREAFRRAWFGRAMEAVKSAEIVFLDPDNGIAGKTASKRTPKGGKYVYWDEVSTAWKNGHSLVIYHHLNRTASVRLQTAELRAKFKDALPGHALMIPVLFRRGSCRHFWVIGQDAHAQYLQQNMTTMLHSGWSRYFEVA